VDNPDNLEDTMNIDAQVALLMKGTAYGDESLHKTMEDELRHRLIEADKDGRPLKVYCGYDPTKADLHLGHTVTMRKLRQFQEFGHEVTFLIGNYTSLIGDPSDKDALRPQMTHEEVAENARTYAEQAFRILDPEKTIIRYNATWLSKITFEELIKLASNFTLQQFFARENFKIRLKKNEPIYLHETFYALMQGYDAYKLKTDVQVGGTDQLFNIITAARKVMPFLGMKPNIGIILGILPGTDGVMKMSKSLENHIPITTDVEDLYGKIMSIPDTAMPSYFRLVTRWVPDKVDTIETQIAEGALHPRDAKMMLALEVASSFYGDEEGILAQEAFIELFQKKIIPDDMPTYNLRGDESILDILLNMGFCKSKGEGRRLMSQNGVTLDGDILSDPSASIPQPGILKVGKRRFVKVQE